MGNYRRLTMDSKLKYTINNMSRKQLESEIEKSNDYVRFWFIMFVSMFVCFSLVLYQLYFM